MKDVRNWVKSGIGNVVESWTTKEMERGEKKFMDSLATFMSLLCRTRGTNTRRGVTVAQMF